MSTMKGISVRAMKKVQVLMSTYNGEKYIRKQLDSLINQDYPDISILIRDDGSSDSTIDIIKEYQKKYNNISLIEEENVGVIKSFFELYATSRVVIVDDYFRMLNIVPKKKEVKLFQLWHACGA